MSLNLPRSPAQITTRWKGLTSETFLDFFLEIITQRYSRASLDRLQPSSYAYPGRLIRVGTWSSFFSPRVILIRLSPSPKRFPRVVLAAERACYRLLRGEPRRQSVVCGRYRVIKHFKSFGSSLLTMVSWTGQADDNASCSSERRELLSV